MAKIKTKFFCSDCGYESLKWLGKCPGCNQWNTFVEELKETKTSTKHKNFVVTENVLKPVSLSQIQQNNESRLRLNISELDRVLGGGIVYGSLVLIGGDPGIGKSTLLLQVANDLAVQDKKILYVSGEESDRQIKLRCERMKVTSENILIYPDNMLDNVVKVIDKMHPDFIIIDSIQTIFLSGVDSSPGSVSQVKECTAELLKVAKSKNIPIFIVGHVTKEGAIAGPRMLEHMVDTVLYFEGERHHTYRIVRAVKNRFGSTNELGIFEMKTTGLVEVTNPSEVFLEERTNGISGSTVVAAMEGTRTVLIEVQSLLNPTAYGVPRKTASGIDNNRLSLIIAVLEKRGGLSLQNYDTYLKITGGLKVSEPAIDLACAISIASSYRDIATKEADVFIGEVGLSGEIRRVSKIEERVMEAKRLGFKRVFIPKGNFGGWDTPKEIDVIGVGTVKEAIGYALDNSTLF